MQDQVISASNYEQHSLNDQNVTTSARNADSNVKPFNIACPALAQGHYQVANSVQQGLAIKCGLAMSRFEYEPLSVLQKSNCKLHCIWSIVTDRTVHNDKPHTVKGRKNRPTKGTN